MPVVTRTQHTVSGGWDIDRNSLRAYTAQVAQEELREAQNEGVFPTDEKSYVTKVDGREGHGREAEVRLGGKILYLRWSAEEDWISGALEIIRLIMRQVPVGRWPAPDTTAAPFRLRHYRDSFVMLRNNSIVVNYGKNFEARAKSYLEKYAQSADPGDRFSVVNIQPYARRIDHGAPGRQVWSTQAPRGVLRRAYGEARRSKKTRGITVYYDVRPLPGGIPDSEVSTQGAGVVYAEGRRNRGKWQYSGRVMRKHRVYPTLTFTPPQQGANSGIGTSVKGIPWTRRGGIYEELGRGGILAGRVPTQPGAAQRRGGVTVIPRRGRR